jgi:type II secretory pathway component PulC
MSKSKLPRDWDHARVNRVVKHYEGQTDEEATAEDEAAYNATTHTLMDVPVDLVSKVRQLIAKRKAS